VEVSLALVDDVKGMALEAGFDLVGIASAEPLREAEESTLEWMREGMAAGMGWITEERVHLSCDPIRLLPGARSIIALARAYPSQVDPGSGTTEVPRGRIARYALGDDYHDVLPPRMRQLLETISSSLGVRPSSRLFVDSSPLSERAVAVRAGLGWFGKNGCLLTGRGSLLLLAEILTDLELQPDRPIRRDCGRCRICLERCPTGALVAPYRVDSRRCISYLTIEHKGAIPVELRPLMGNWVFGCDVCQEVCPHNRLPRSFEERAFAPRMGVGATPALLPLLSLDGPGFKSLFRGSPVLRTKRRGLLRNVAVALGNAGDPAAVPALSVALEDPEPLIRGHAAWALGRIGGKQARTALDRSLAIEAEDEVRGEIRSALG
jgi:epoxyqueuosine reductase